MKQIKLVRVDDRLIHAQIIIFWLKKFNINTIYIIDNELAKNAFLCQIYRLTTPPHIQIKIFTVNQAIKNIHEVSSTSRILILIKNLNTVIDLYKFSFPLDTVQIGGNILESGLNKKQILDQLLSQFSVELSFLLNHSIRIYWQSTVDSEKMYINLEQIQSFIHEHKSDWC